LLLLACLPVTGMNWDYSGQLTLRGGWNRVAAESLFHHYLGDSYADASAELRLMPEWSHGPHHAVLHYEAVALNNELLRLPPGLLGSLPGTAYALPDDSRRLFDLTHVFDGSGKKQSYHRLDRLFYRYSGDWGDLTLGRSAVTWGNGFVFNPMDLFNPFAPTDVERDYKLGDDLLLLHFYPSGWNGQMDWQLLVVPRRNPASGNLRMDQSSVALKAHLLGSEMEWDFLAAWHYDELVAGIGTLGYLGNAVWRWDTTLAFPGEGDPLLSTVANIDYSWTWGGRNWYGSLEFHYNNIGTGDYQNIPAEDNLLARLERGEMYTLGRAYLAPSVQVELHPLVNLYLAGIVNVEDPSAVLLPRLVWNMSQNTELTLGANLALGGRGTEFGGIELPGMEGTLKAPGRVYLWLKAFF